MNVFFDNGYPTHIHCSSLELIVTTRPTSNTRIYPTIAALIDPIRPAVYTIAIHDIVTSEVNISKMQMAALPYIPLSNLPNILKCTTSET